ncbi:MAG: hypothetical protein FJ100_02490 [Deltaproteobacteria bacterium]|nr:hypothetical protein [Deltaproteobacteria bacterium]
MTQHAQNPVLVWTVAITVACAAALPGPARGAPPGPTMPPSPSPAEVDKVASADDDLAAQWETAVNYFKYHEFDKAIERLSGLLYPTTRLDARRELRAREYLGAAYWWQGKREAAADEFTALLVRAPGSRLEPAQYPPKMIEEFEARKKRLVDTGVIKGQAPPPDLDGPDARRAVAPPFYMSLFPFGVGQFSNRQPVKGWILLGSEALLGGLSAALYLRNRDAGRVGDRPWKDDAWQISAGAAFWLLAGYGVWDAWTTHRATWPPPPAD